MTKKRVLPIARLLLVIAAPFLWYWLFGWGTVHIIDFSAQEVEYVQISCSHYPERGAIYDPGEIQALIDETKGPASSCFCMESAWVEVFYMTVIFTSPTAQNFH